LLYAMRWTLQSYLLVALTATVAAGFTTLVTRYKHVFSMLRARWFRDVFEDLRLRLRASEAAAIRERLDLLEAKILSSSNSSRLSVHSPRTLAEEKPIPEWDLVTREDFVTLRTRVDDLSKELTSIKSQADKSLQVSEDMLRQYLQNAVSTKEQLSSFSQSVSSLLQWMQQIEKAFHSLQAKLESQESSAVLKSMDTELSSLRSFVEDVNEEVRNLRMLVNQGNVSFSNSSVLSPEGTSRWEGEEKDKSATLEQSQYQAEEEEEEEKKQEEAGIQASESGEKKKRKKKKKTKASAPAPMTS